MSKLRLHMRLHILKYVLACVQNKTIIPVISHTIASTHE